MPVQLNSVHRERLQNADEKDTIELYYELLSSGHSVGEILEALNFARNKTEHGNAAAAEYRRAKSDGVPTGTAAEVASEQGAQANARRIPGLSNPRAANAADDDRAEQVQATESTPPGARESDNRERLPDNLPGSGPDIAVPVGVQTSADCDVMLRPGDRQRTKSGRFPGIVKRIAFGTLYAAVTASAVVGFSTMPVVRDTQFTSDHVPQSVSGGMETAAVPRTEAGRAEAVENTRYPKKRAVDADISRAPEPLQPAEPDPTAPDPEQRVMGEVRATSSAARQPARESHGSEAGQLDETRVPALAAVPSDPVMPHESPATAPTQASDAANDAEPARAHAADPAATATLATATTRAPKPDPEAHDIALATPVGAESRADSDRGRVQAASLAETARAEQPDATRPPAREATVAAPTPRIAEITPEATPFKNAEADALVTRGDALFATGDLASARLFYEYAVAAGNGVAALRLGGTFDPGFLARAQIGRVQGDPAIALYWYRRARDLGDKNAEILLKRMENTAR